MDVFVKNFVNSFFFILRHHPKHIGIFYSPKSIVSSGIEGDIDKPTIGIPEKPAFQGFAKIIDSVHQNAGKDRVIIMIVGMLPDEQKKFTRTFLVQVKKRGGFKILHDVVRFLKPGEYSGEIIPVETPLRIMTSEDESEGVSDIDEENHPKSKRSNSITTPVSPREIRQIESSSDSTSSPSSWNGSKQLDDSRTIWVGKIPQGTTEIEILNIFQEIGDISNILLIPKKNFCFVEFSDESSVQNSLKGSFTLHSTELRLAIKKRYHRPRRQIRKRSHNTHNTYFHFFGLDLTA